ncbi:hypothetical protein V5O48_018214, partial [Marasmius crinis-equi]
MTSDFEPGEENLYHSVYQDGDDVKSLSLSLHEDTVEHDATSSEISFESYWTGESDDEADLNERNTASDAPGKGENKEVEADELPFFEGDIPAIFGLLEPQPSVAVTWKPDASFSYLDDDSFSYCSYPGDSEDGESDIPPLQNKHLARYEDQLGGSTPSLSLAVTHTGSSPGNTTHDKNPIAISAPLAAIDATINTLLASVNNPSTRVTEQALLAQLKNDLDDALREVLERDTKIVDMVAELKEIDTIFVNMRKLCMVQKKMLGEKLQMVHQAEAQEGDARASPVVTATGVQTDGGRSQADPPPGDQEVDYVSQLEAQIVALEARLRDSVVQQADLQAALGHASDENLRLEAAYVERATRSSEDLRVLQIAKDKLAEENRRLEAAFEERDAEAAKLKEVVRVLQAEKDKLAEAKSLLLTQTGAKISQLDKETVGLTEKNEALRKERDTAKGALEEERKRRRDLKAALSDASRASSDMEKTLDFLNAEVEKREKEKETLQKQLEAFRNDAENKTKTIATLKADGERKDKEISTVKGRDAASRSDVEKMKATINELNRHKQLREMVHESLRADMQQRDLQLAEAKKNVSATQGQLEEVKKKAGTLQARLTEEQKKASTLQAQQDTANATI